MLAEDPLEQGIGPVNLGLVPVQLEDGLDELGEGQTVFLKSERILLALAFLGILIFSLYNIYQYLYKAHMYSSYPLVFAYSILVLYGIMGVCYEIYMGFRCGQQDCFTHLLVSIMPEYRVYFYNERH